MTLPRSVTALTPSLAATRGDADAAEKWLAPRLADFTAGNPDISFEFETDHREVDRNRRRDFDVWTTDIRCCETAPGTRIMAL